MSSAAALPAPSSDDGSLRAALALGALGVVFGDIGTSPIYALREALRAAGPDHAEATVFGLLSLVFWAVVLVVALKYVVVVMRADNQGEGGTMSLLSLALPVCGRYRPVLLVVGLAGASLFVGDAMITPAISVLSAIEGIKLVAPRVEPYVVPIAATVLVLLFAIQSRGSGKVGKLFGPVMLCWFALLAVAGAMHIAKRPEVLAALHPKYALHYLTHAEGWIAFAVLGSVFLALTGGEALYADMGHFGRRAIRVDWFALVMPALVLNYLGQGALVLGDPEAASDPFFLLFDRRFLAPVVVLSTAATVIASQAVISGAFALAQQAMQLGVLPRLRILQTSHESAGQVYVPSVNWLLAIAVLGLVVGFRSSDALANAYGIAVAGNMLVTTVLVGTVARGLWKWSWIALAPTLGFFLVLDVAFVSANLRKVAAGGWVPLTIGVVTLAMMLCWRRGREVAFAHRDEQRTDLDAFIVGLARPDAPLRVHGVAVYLTQSLDVVPQALELNLKHNSVLHEQVVLLTVMTERMPRVAEASRVKTKRLPAGFERVELRFGFAEKPDVPAALGAHAGELGFDPKNASYFLGRETPVPSLRPALPRWQERIYAFLAHNAVRAPDYFLIPPAQAVELGTRVEM